MDFPSYSYLPISMTHYLSPDPPPSPTKDQLKALQEVTLPLLKNILRYLVRDSKPNRSGIESESEKETGTGIGIGKDKSTPQGCGCGWDPEEIHLFGWGEGGTIGLELGRSLALSSSSPSPSASISTSSSSTENGNGNRNGNGQEKEDKDRNSKRINRLGSAVSISGDLYSTPPVGAKDLGGETPVLYFHRPRVKPSPSPSSTSSASPNSSDSDSPSWLKRTFAHPQTITGKFSPVAAQQDEKGRDIRMPEGREEWEGVMRFWSEVLVRPGMEETSGSMAGEVYEVVR